MSESKDQKIKLLEQRLNDFVRTVLKEAENNPDFCAKLDQVLLGDTIKVISVEPKKARTKSSFDVIGFLHDHGEQKLREELSAKSDAELIGILRAEGIKKGKELKHMQREQMIEEILQTANRRLGQGKSFLQ